MWYLIVSIPDLCNLITFRIILRETNLANVAVLIVERFSLDSGKIDFPIQIVTLSIICFKVSQVDFPNKCVLSL